jgi:hypothetical protein
MVLTGTMTIGALGGGYQTSMFQAVSVGNSRRRLLGKDANLASLIPVITGNTAGALMEAKMHRVTSDAVFSYSSSGYYVCSAR